MTLLIAILALAAAGWLFLTKPGRTELATLEADLAKLTAKPATPAKGATGAIGAAKPAAGTTGATGGTGAAK